MQSSMCMPGSHSLLTGPACAGMLAMAASSSGGSSTDTSIAFCSVKSVSQSLAISQNGYTEACAPPSHTFYIVLAELSWCNF